MAENSNIEWTRHTFNPWIGCTKVGPGCDHCYAEAWDARGLQQFDTRWGAKANRTRTAPANWRKPVAWDRAAADAGERHRVFCASLADVFDNHASILPEWRTDLWALIRATPNLDWMLLTKRPGNIAKMLPEDWGTGYPNVWLGCTVVNQEEADRDIPKLLAVPARIRFLSMEPLLGPVDLAWAFPDIRMGCCHRCGFRTNAVGGYCPNDGSALRGDIGVDLVIVGGESGKDARPMHPQWARDLRDQCVAAGVAFHFKQWGEWHPHDEGMLYSGPQSKGDGFVDHFVGAGSDARLMLRVGKRNAGRKLDGRTWDQMPEVHHA